MSWVMGSWGHGSGSTVQVRGWFQVLTPVHSPQWLFWVPAESGINREVSGSWHPYYLMIICAKLDHMFNNTAMKKRWVCLMFIFSLWWVKCILICNCALGAYRTVQQCEASRGARCGHGDHGQGGFGHGSGCGGFDCGGGCSGGCGGYDHGCSALW